MLAECLFPQEKNVYILIRSRVIGCLGILNSLAPGRCGCNLKFSNSYQWLMVSCTFLVKMPSGEFNKPSLMIIQHCFRSWLGAIRQQAITWVNVDPVSCRHMAWPGHNDLTHWGRKLGHRHWFRKWFVACSAPSRYLNQCWLIVNWTPASKFQ